MTKKKIKSVLVVFLCCILLVGCAADSTVNEDAGNEYEVEELEVRRNGMNIYGVIYRPQGAEEKMPAVIYAHGIGGSYSDGENYADALARQGYVVYCFDFCGGSTGSRSDGSTTEMSIFTEEQDLKAVLDMIRNLDYVDEDKVFLLGASQGGAVSAITAADYADEVAGMVLLYPAFVLVDEVKEMFGSVEAVPDTFRIFIPLGRPYAADLFDYDIYEDIQEYDKDVLIIHGDADSIVPLSYSERAVEVYSSAELKVLSGAGHGFYGADDEQTIEWMTEYLNQHR